MHVSRGKPRCAPLEASESHESFDWTSSQGVELTMSKLGARTKKATNGVGQDGAADARRVHVQSMGSVDGECRRAQEASSRRQQGAAEVEESVHGQDV